MPRLRRLQVWRRRLYRYWHRLYRHRHRVRLRLGLQLQLLPVMGILPLVLDSAAIGRLRRFDWV
jgi:hypothetical protein